MNRASVHAQSGAALIVALIFLVILTLLGITAATVTGLEERMAGNTRDRDLAFESAEAAMRDGEARLRYAAFRTAAKVLDCTSANDAAYWNAYNWNSASAPTQTLNQVAQQAKIVVQCRLNPCPSPFPNPAPACPSTATTFRITTWGVGSSTNAVVILQAEYVYTP